MLNISIQIALNAALEGATPDDYRQAAQYLLDEAAEMETFNAMTDAEQDAFIARYNVIHDMLSQR